VALFRAAAAWPERWSQAEAAVLSAVVALSPVRPFERWVAVPLAAVASWGLPQLFPAWTVALRPEALGGGQHRLHRPWA